MNKKIVDNTTYTFDANDGTITFLPESDEVTLANLLLITNVTHNKIIYNFGCEGFGGTINFNIVTLEQTTSSFNDSDELQIVIYTEQTPAQEATLNLLEAQKQNLECLQNIVTELEETNLLLKLILK